MTAFGFERQHLIVQVPDIALDRAGGGVRNSLTASTAGPPFLSLLGARRVSGILGARRPGPASHDREDTHPRVDPELDAVVDAIRIQP